MAIEKITASLPNKLNKITEAIGNRLSNSLGKTTKKGADTFVGKAIKAIEPTGSNNNFVPMFGLMMTAVVLPRVRTALKRNPDNKEATRDEIAEILFRDLQTVAVLLFLLKSLNSGIGAITTKIKGLPMNNKAYLNVFNSTQKGLEGFKEKAGEFLAHPVKKLKIIGKNILDTVHPTNGVITLSDDQFVSKYSGYETKEEISKLFEDIKNFGGANKNEKGAKKVFNKVMDLIINEQDKYIQTLKEKNLRGEKVSQATFNKAKNILEELKSLKEKGYTELPNINPETENCLALFFKNPDNKLVMDAKGLNSILRTVALAIEVFYLGFGLPTLNQKRLEKRYLNKEDNFQPNTSKTKTNPIDDNHIKAHEVQLYASFLSSHKK